MNREFMELYNRELSLFYEQAEEFAEEYPGVAERLGAMTKDNPDPMIGALIEGAAFLATRVQLKLKHEFATFTNNLIEQLTPNFLAPVPSTLLAQVRPVFGDPALRKGRRVSRGAYLDATYRERDRQVACRYWLADPITIFPLEIMGAEYFGSVAPLEGMGLPLDPEAQAGLRIKFRVRTNASDKGEPDPEKVADKPNAWAEGLEIDALTMHLLDAEADAIAVYEQIFGRSVQAFIRWKEPTSKHGIRQLPLATMLEQIGFGDDEGLFPIDHRVLRGLDHIRDYVVFPRRFLGLRLRDLERHLTGIRTPLFELIFVFNEVNPRLGTVIDKGTFGLNCGSAVNLFEKTADRILLRRSNDHEHQVVPERSRYLDYEPHRIISVEGILSKGGARIPIYPLYSSPEEQTPIDKAIFYSTRRMQRRRTVEENKFGMRSDYMGTDMFLSLAGIEQAEERGEDVAELSLRILCSNRHLPEFLPVGETGADFRFVDDDTLAIRVIGQPTPPREPILTAVSDRSKATFAGENAWRLINIYSLNHLGLAQNRAGNNAQALKDILSLFADLSDNVAERRIRGIRSIAARPVTRRVRAMSGVAAARGLEVTVMVEEKAFEGSGVFLLGAVLDRFFADYVGLNQFTQTVLRSPERKEVMRWPPRMGRRHAL